MTASILIIAGSDSGGGAGIQADIKTVTMLGGHAMTAITAITAQNSMMVLGIEPVPPQMVGAQIMAVLDDIGVDAIKIGMLGSAKTAEVVAECLSGWRVPIVLDPVMIATSGAALADRKTIAAMEKLISMATLVTPNLPELKALGGVAAIRTPTLIKGGHGKGDIIIDRLVGPEGEIARWEAPRINTHSTHGTGCTLATAIATGLGQGLKLHDAIERARLFVRLALRDAPGLGGGHGPMGHQFVRNDGLALGPSLNQVTVGASDYGASVAFYQALGLRQIVDSPDNGYARFEAINGTTLSIHADGGEAGGAVVYFESPRLDAWVDELVTAGLVFDQMPKDEDWLWREARLRDPHGNMVCLYHAGEDRRYPPWRV